MKCQALVLTRQMRRAYLEMVSNTSVAQAYIKRYLAMLWYKRIKDSKDNLENHIDNINEMISKFNVNANQFKQQFPGHQASAPHTHLEGFEKYEIAKA